MNSRVFISCGQQSDEERRLAAEVGNLLRNMSFDVYVAVESPTILEINTGIIRELKNSDYYLLINFRRDMLSTDSYRGSLFSNQEFAIAYALGFENILIVNEAGVRSEGLLRYVAINTESFDRKSDCIAAVKRALGRANWRNGYSRRLIPTEVRVSEQIYSYQNLRGWFVYVAIQNGRPDIAALDTAAQLNEISRVEGKAQPCKIRSPLKASGRPGFTHTIFPQSREEFDILVIGEDNRRPDQLDAYLNCALDVQWPSPLGVDAGIWEFRYTVVALDFPPLTFTVEIDFPERFEIKPSARISDWQTA